MKNIITIEQLDEVLEQRNNLRLKLSDKTFSLETEIEVVISEAKAEVRTAGYSVSVDDTEEKIKFSTKKELFLYLYSEEILTNDEAELVDIENRFQTYKEYVEYMEFINISMDKLLKKYQNADMFSLTGPYNAGFSEEKPYGIYAIDNKTATKALNIIKEQSYNNLRYYYDNFTKKEKDLLPSFKKLISDIEEESSAYFDLVESGKIPKGQSPFLCDLIYEGKTKYSGPQNLWHFYHDIYSQYYNYEKAIFAMQKNKTVRDMLDIFDNPHYRQLKKSFHKTEVTFSWHCTTSSMLSIVYYFNIDKNSLSWLSMLKDDYDMKELDDLAFYQDGKLVFSSCTHEHFHNDITIRKDETIKII